MVFIDFYNVLIEISFKNRSKWSKSSKIVQINQLAREKGIGIKTLEKIFAVSSNTIPTNSSKKIVQQSLF